MKRIICLIISAALMIITLAGCSSASISGKVYDYNSEKTDKTLVQGNTEFAFDIFKELNRDDKDKSIFISPLSISAALSMTYQGAGGATREAMAEALNYKGLDIKTLNSSYKNLLDYLKQADSKIELNINNSIWMRKGEKIKEDFLKVNKNIFNAHISELDFSKKDAADEINKWIDNSTKGKIKDMVESPIPDDVFMYLINAIYFKGMWAEQFDKKNTFNTEFKSGGAENVQIDMMSRTGSVEYGEGDGFKAVRLPYGNGKTAMYCILPEDTLSIDKFIESMNSNKWSEIRSSITMKKDVIIQIPRFKIEYGIKDLKSSLSSLGMEVAFSDSADFSGIRDNAAISSVLHKAVIEVNEEGSEAAAATVVEVRLTSAIIDPPSFIADRPFLFVIADDASETILFMGKLYDINSTQSRVTGTFRCLLLFL